MLTETQINNLLDEMNLEEKIGMVHGDEIFATKGVKRLNVPILKSKITILKNTTIYMLAEYMTNFFFPKFALPI